MCILIDYTRFASMVKFCNQMLGKRLALIQSKKDDSP